LEGGKAEFNEKVDEKGPLPLVVAASGEKGKGLVAVFGDSDFATNQHLNLFGNKDLILNTVAWLVSEELLITIRPKFREMTPLLLKDSQKGLLFFGYVLAPPLVVLIIGVGVFLFRRRYR